MFWFIPALFLVPLGLAIFGMITMWLWNALIPQLFHGPVLTFWQTVGLLILTRILFSGFGHRRWGGHHRWRNEKNWRMKWEQKMAGMTDEEKERVMRRFGCRWQNDSPETPAQSGEAS